MPLYNDGNQPANPTPARGGNTYNVRFNADVTDQNIDEEAWFLQDSLTTKSSFRMAQMLPPSCFIQWAELKNQTDVPVSGTDTTNTANGWAIILSTATAVVAATGTVTVSTGLLFYIANTSSSNYRRGIADNRGVINTNTVPMYMYIVPAAPTATSAAIYYVGATGTQTLTAGYKFGTGTATNTNTYKARIRLTIRSIRSMAA